VAKHSETRVMAVLDGAPQPVYKAIHPASLRFSPCGRHLVYAAQQGDKSFLVVDGKPIEGYDQVSPTSAVFSATGEHLALVAWKDEKAHVVMDGASVGAYDGAGDIAMDAEGKRLAFVAAEDGKQFVVADGKRGPAWRSFGRQGLRISADGTHVAYAAARAEDRWQVVLDGKPGEEFDGIQTAFPVFSPDGRHLAYVAKKGDEVFVVQDGHRGPTFDDVIDWADRGLQGFDETGTLRYLGVRKDTVFRVTHVPPNPKRGKPGTPRARTRPAKGA